MTDRDAYLLRRILSGLEVEDTLDEVSVPFRGIAEQLAALPLDDRQSAFERYLVDHPDSDSIAWALARADPTGPAPEATPRPRPANLSDVRGRMSETQWIWEGYLPASRISGIAAFEGVGKTRLA
jgi:hypothetical protein